MRCIHPIALHRSGVVDMDIATVIGFVLAIGAVVGSILVSGDLMGFIDVPSIIVVLLGVTGATCIKWPLEVLLTIFKKAIVQIFRLPDDVGIIVDEIGKLAETARRESVFALEKVVVADPFLAKATALAADNRPPEVISSILKLEVDAIEERHRVGQNVFRGIQEDGPAFGMIGTLIGLVVMLANLSDQAAIGPAMAIALLTTFYGSCIANIFGGPINNKLTYRSKLEMLKMKIIIEGTLSIVAGENPRLIKEKLNSFLPSDKRVRDEEPGGQ